MCKHEWREYYADFSLIPRYRICKKCGIAQERDYDGQSLHWRTNKNLCKTNSWILKEIQELRNPN